MNINLTDEEVKILRTIWEVTMSEPEDIDRLAEVLGESSAATEDQLDDIRSKLFGEIG